MRKIDSACSAGMIGRGFAVTAVFTAALVPSMAIAQDSCSRPLCKVDETYRADSGASETYGWCRHTGFLGAKSHQRRDCPSGWTLQRATGNCVQRNCCPEKPLCPPGERYARSGTHRGEVYGVCESSSGGYKSHQLLHCETGWRLDTARGICKKDCPVTVTGGIVVPAPSHEAPAGSKGKPDLVVRTFGFARQMRCEAGKPLLIFSVRVANIGTAPSPAIAGKAMVQVKEDRRGWGNGVALPAIAPGASVSVEVPVSYLGADPGYMVSGAPHPFRATVDPLRLVDEANEGNNTSAVINLSAPSGCAGLPGR